MVWTIARKELLKDLRSFRFVACFLLCIILFTVSSIVGAQDFETRLRTVQTGESQEEEKLSELRVYSHLKPIVYRRPGPLSVFNQGYGRSFSPSVQISHRKIPYLTPRERTDNPYLDIIPPIDISTVVRVILSLLAVLLSFDAISGEKEAGTLRLLLSNPVPRARLLFGKYLGGMITLTAALMTGFLLGIVILTIVSPVGIRGREWLSLLTLTLVSIGYLSLFLLLGLMVSSVTRRSATSLIILLSLWLFLVIIAPNVAAFIAAGAVDVPSELERELEVAQLERQVEEQVEEYAASLEPSEPVGELTVYGEDGEVLVRLGRPERYAWLNDYYSYRVDRWMQAARLIWERNQEHLRALRRQVEVADGLSRISPAFLYDRVTRVFSGTDLESYENFVKQAREYRAQLMEYVEEQDGFHSSRWFTDDPPDQEPFVLDPENFDRGDMDMERGWRLLTEAENDRSRILDLGDMPRFSFIPRTFGEAVGRAMFDLSLLIGMNLFLFTVYTVMFMRYDAR